MKKTLIAIIGILALLITGCKTSYKYDVNPETGEQTFESSSYREFQRLEFSKGDMWLKASGVTDDTAETVQAVSRDVADAWILYEQCLEDFMLYRNSMGKE